MQDRILPLSPLDGYEIAYAAAYVVVGEENSDISDFPCMVDLEDMMDSLRVADEIKWRELLDAFATSKEMSGVFELMGAGTDAQVAAAAPVIKSHSGDMHAAQEHLRACIEQYTSGKNAWM